MSIPQVSKVLVVLKSRSNLDIVYTISEGAYILSCILHQAMSLRDMK